MKLFKSSGRSKRFRLLALLFTVSGLYTAYLFSSGESLGLALSTLGLTSLIGIVSCLLVNCPNCSKSWLYYAISKIGTGNWIGYLEEMDKCPYCGYNQLNEHNS